jgi:hypothetical protein
LVCFQVGEEIAFFVEGKQLQSDPVVRIRGPTSTPQVKIIFLLKVLLHLEFQFDTEQLVLFSVSSLFYPTLGGEEKVAPCWKMYEYLRVSFSRC